LLQKTDLEVTPPGADDSASAADPKSSPDRDLSVPHPKLQLTLRGPNIPGVNDIEVELTDPDRTIFGSCT
jgi:E3 ubiquitin-protein ligase HECTD1